MDMSPYAMDDTHPEGWTPTMDETAKITTHSAGQSMSTPNAGGSVNLCAREISDTMATPAPPITHTHPKSWGVSISGSHENAACLPAVGAITYDDEKVGEPADE